MVTMADKFKLARAFIEALPLTPEQFAEASARNLAETDPHICHTHDFCDANQAMIDALESLGVEVDTQDEAQAAWIASAWELAKMADFDLETLAER